MRVTRRLLLEPLRVEHAEEMSALLDDERLHEFIGGAPLTRDGVRRRFAQLAAGRSPDGTEQWHNWILRRRQNHVAVGCVQATVRGLPPAETAAMAWTVGIAFQGHGYAREGVTAAIEQLMGIGVRQYTASIHPEHQASIGVARAVGLSPTRTCVDGEVVWAGQFPDPEPRPSS